MALAWLQAWRTGAGAIELRCCVIPCIIRAYGPDRSTTLP
ncbi:MAG: hypothetical protein HW416_2569 [Chloroflexi bacterium]|nr:hypothetical protein [Chloroflexota bacterium]